MAAMPKRGPQVACTACKKQNDTERGGTDCIWCGTQLPAPWGGDYIRNNPPKEEEGEKK